MSSRFKLWLFSGVLLLLLLTFFEGLNFAVLHVMERWRRGCVVELYVKDLFREHVTAKDVRGFTMHDPEIGWVNRPNMDYTAKNVAGVDWRFTSDERAARGGEGNEGPLLATTYGDSFTAAVEVNDDQTWEVYLSRELGGAVLNFGVTAYCPLQAVLRMERHLHQGLVAPVTVLGFWEGDLFRLVNRYRPYFAPEENGWNMFKPALRARNGEVRLLPNLWRSTNIDVADLRRQAVLAADDDFFAQRWARLSFPYSMQTLRLLFGRARASWTFEAMWSDPESKAVLHYLVNRFVSSVRKAGSQPVLLLLPDAIHLKEKSAPWYREFEEEVRRRQPELIVVDVYQEEIIGADFNILPFEGHTSAYGNRIIAGALARALRDLKVVRLARER